MSNLIVKNIFLKEIRFKLNPLFKKKSTSDQISIKNQIRIKTKVVNTNIYVNLIAATPPVKESKNYPFHFFVEMAGIFEFDGEFKKNHIDGLAQINCPAIIFPYLREALADITRRSGFPPFHLQPINFVENAKKQQSERDQLKEK